MLQHLQIGHNVANAHMILQPLYIHVQNVLRIIILGVQLVFYVLVRWLVAENAQMQVHVHNAFLQVH